MAIALNVPLFVVVTKVDLCPEPVMKETMKQLSRLLKLPGARKQPYAVRTIDELMMAVRGFGKTAITPVISISSVDGAHRIHLPFPRSRWPAFAASLESSVRMAGTNVPLLRSFFNLLPSRRSWASQARAATEISAEAATMVCDAPP